MFVGRNRLSFVRTLVTLAVVLTLQTIGFPQPSERDRGPLRQLGLRPGSDTGVVSVIILLEDEPLATYRGHIAGLAATNRESLGTARLNPRSTASQRYLAYLAQKHGTFETTLLGSIPTAQIIHRFRVALNGMSALIPEHLIEAVRQLPGVKAVYPDTVQHPATERSSAFIGVDQAWQQLGGPVNAGEGVIIGVLDTGIWPEQPSFADPDPSGKPYTMPSGWRGFCEAPSDSSAPLNCNNKLIGTRQFLNTYKAFIGLTAGEFDSARDSEGHGTHTASTAAGNFWVESDLLGIPRGAASGIAPRAHVAVYRVCAQEACFSSDSVAAVDQAIADGVDVINFSISGSRDPYSNAVELGFLGAYAAGVFVAASAGNNGPAPDTVDHRGGWVTTVAASTTDRHFSSEIVLTASDGASLLLTGASITAGITTPAPVVLGKSFGDSLCNFPFPAGTFNGAIVVCERGDVARVAKSFNVAAGGAEGLLLYNPIAQGLAADNHFIPTVHVENDAGAALLNFLASHAGVTATFSQGTATAVQGDILAAFSSRGGPQQELGISKPDVTAPGVQILAGHTPQPHKIDGGMPGEVFQVIQGTSMSTPHVAGAAALLNALRPAWGPDQIKSALMTTAKTVHVFSEDGVSPSYPFEAGSGRIDLSKAGNPGLTFKASDEDYVEHRNTLWLVNYPSLYVPRLSDSITVPRTVHSELSAASLWHMSVVAPADLVVTMPTFLFVPPGGIRQFNITVDASAVPSGTVRHASLYLTWPGFQVTFPITIVRR